MTGSLTPASYGRLIDDDIAWLEASAPDTLERQHIVRVLKSSMDRSALREIEYLKERIARVGLDIDRVLVRGEVNEQSPIAPRLRGDPPY